MQPRPLSTTEREVLDLLLQRDGVPGVEAFRVQAQTAMATSGCSCGCGTITLHPSSEAPVAEYEGQLAGSALFSHADGSPRGGLLLFVEQGRLATLEVYGYGNDPEPIPPVDVVKVEPSGTNSHG